MISRNHTEDMMIIKSHRDYVPQRKFLLRAAESCVTRLPNTDVPTQVGIRARQRDHCSKSNSQGPENHCLLRNLKGRLFG